jgi:GcrA cell cycle regulator
MSWTDDQISSLRNLWSAGKSASEIAASLGTVTRNAVIGKAHRLGLDARPSPIKGPIRPKEERMKQRENEKLHTILGLSEKMCKWPIGDPRQPDFHFCGGESQSGLPYCEEHAAMAYQPARKQNDEKLARL